MASERARISVAMNNWELALEAASEASGRCVNDYDLQLLHVLRAFGDIGDLDAARPAVALLCEPIDLYERENAAFIVHVVV
jgi:hypothetical protein